MSVLQHAPRYAAAAVTRLARELYGLEAVATPLPSERDQNFLLTVESGERTDRLVLKIANAAEDRGLLEAQNALLDHLSSLGLCPRVLRTTAGEAIALGPEGHYVRLLTWIPGEPLAAIADPPAALLDDLGRRLGQLDRALADLDHPALHREFHWDLAQAFHVVRRYGGLIADDGLRGLVDRMSAHVEARDARALSRVRRSVIHGDVNDHNVLVARLGVRPGSDRGQTGVRPGSDPGSPAIRGFLDLGDAVHSYTVADLAIAIAYAVLDKPDPLATAVFITRAYHAEYPLTDDELSVLFGLVQLRLCVSVCMAACQQPERPRDEYLGISQVPIRRTLPLLAAIHPDAAEEQFRAGVRSCFLHGPASRTAVQETRSDPGPLSATDRRRELIAPNVSIGYSRPLKLARGWMQYLYDDEGRRYLDAYNNVPHVGHSHPRVAAVVADQLRALNTNTRYLHDGLWQFAERLVATLPDPLRVCYFVNSGSEANELALRLARAHTGAHDVIVQDAAYHGNTTTLIDISPYKFNGPGGQGKPAWVHVAPLPDDYRGPYKRGDAQAGAKYADAVGELVAELRRRDVRPAAFVAETCPSVGGQIVPPQGYLEAAYRHVRSAGAVCIADEVQTAYGRLGTHFYAFEAQEVVPDIVVLGKPIGNGYPLGAVVTTREIAASFDNGMEFFSTFGGSTASCAVGLAVLDVVREERLPSHARRVGERLLVGLRSLASAHPLIGDVRGSGYFLGVELVKDRITLEPAADAASIVVNRMRDDGVLIGTDGPLHNVLKIRPPMPFDDGDADRLVAALDAALRDIAAP
jgi:4-aminobutyrate aminotransferase-like enzyme/Ser/Thr protein kinase RdoA (MazF antagonist)